MRSAVGISGLLAGEDVKRFLAEFSAKKGSCHHLGCKASR
jgi:hypothetical protein